MRCYFAIYRVYQSFNKWLLSFRKDLHVGNWSFPDG
jgi:hypothetical protein